MKKIIGFLVSLLMLLSIMLVSPVQSFTETKLDPQGIDPWLSMYHDSHNTAYSSSGLRAPFKDGFQWERDTANGYFPSVPVIYDNVMYVVFVPDGRTRSADLYAMDITDGEPDEIWSISLEGLLRTSPVLDPENNRLFIAATTGFGEKSQGTNSTVYCLDMEDGAELWYSTVDGASFSSLCYDSENSKIFLSTFWVHPKSNKLGDIEFDVEDSEGVFYCLDAENGEELWWAPLAGGSTEIMTAAVADGMVFVTHGHTWYSSSRGFIIPALRASALYAFDVETGALNWKYTAGENAGFAGSPSVADGRVYVVMAYGDFNSQLNGVVACLDAQTGFEEWKYSYTGFANNVVPILTEEAVLFVSNDASIYALDKYNGRRQWNKKVSDSPSYININFYAAAAGNFVFTQGPNFDSRGNALGYRLQIFDIEAKGRSVFKEDVERDNATGPCAYGKSIFFNGYMSIFQFVSDIPELTVSPSRILLGEIERNTSHEARLNISNRGAKGLEGEVSVSDSWLSVDVAQVSDDTRAILVTVNTDNLDLTDYSGSVIFTTNGGNVTIPVNFTVVDTTPPEVEIITDDLVVIEEKFYTNQPEYVLKGRTEATATVVVQDRDAEIDADGIFEVSLSLNEGENTIIIEATDDVGNQAESSFTLNLDSKAPLLTITSPNYKLAVDPNDYIMGMVDDLKAEVTINGEVVQLAPNGSFAKMVFLARGINEFIVQAKDQVGNITEVKHYIVFPEKKLIILFIGRTSAEINGVPVTLDVPPRIIRNRTMVPLRFVTEAMGAEIQWEASEQKITLTLYGKEIILRVGATTAMVNGNPVILDASPTIIGGRTLVPIRFISENLGAKVDWEGTQQRITITFPAS